MGSEWTALVICQGQESSHSHCDDDDDGDDGDDDDGDDDDDDDDLYIIGAVCLYVCMYVCYEKAESPYSKDFVVSPVYTFQK